MSLGEEAGGKPEVCSSWLSGVGQNRIGGASESLSHISTGWGGGSSRAGISTGGSTGGSSVARWAAVGWCL